MRLLGTVAASALAAIALPMAAGCGAPSGGLHGPSSSPLAATSTPIVATSPIPMPTTVQLSAPSDSVVWALVGGVALFRSTDRGQTWQRRPLPPGAGPLRGASFVDAAEGWLLESQCGARSTSMWHTTDAGGTWRRLAAAELAGDQCMGELSFVDPARGFLPAPGRNRATVVYLTADGGRTWAPSRPLPGRGEVSPGRVRAFGSTLLVQAGGTIFGSDDGGVTWSARASTPSPAALIGFVTATRWLSLSGPGQDLETLDAGATWHAYASDYAQAAPVAPEVVFGDAEVGYATVRGSIRRTRDGGRHWTAVETPGTAPA